MYHKVTYLALLSLLQCLVLFLVHRHDSKYTTYCTNCHHNYSRQKPDLLDILPHLQEDSFVPLVELKKDGAKNSSSNTRKLVIGVPTVDRPKDNYLLNTLTSLFANMDADEEDDAFVVVLVSENHQHIYTKILQDILSRFNETIHKDLLRIIVPRKSFYPRGPVKLNFESDDATRTRWRTKANLDKAYLMHYSKNIGEYFLQLEDDVETVPNYVTTILNFTSKQNALNPDWIMLEFCQLGAIGKLLRTSQLPQLIWFTLQLHAFQPNDWIFSMFLYAQKCFLGQDIHRCHKHAKTRHVISHEPSLFQHIGQQSSLRGVKQPLKDKMFPTKPDDWTNTQNSYNKRYTKGVLHIYPKEFFQNVVDSQPGRQHTNSQIEINKTHEKENKTTDSYE